MIALRLVAVLAYCLYNILLVPDVIDTYSTLVNASLLMLIKRQYSGSRLLRVLKFIDEIF